MSSTGDTAPAGRPFKDHFSGHSRGYAAHRPAYPESLFAYLANNCTRHRLAWDCATGSGQAAKPLTAYFRKVIATDASQAQILAAQPHPKIDYRVAIAEASGLEDACADLITVAQALHWLDIGAFFDEARRVLAPGGLLACWCYSTCVVDPACDRLIRELYGEVVHDYWLPERRLVEDGYGAITLPLPPVGAPEFAMKTHWRAADMLGYLRTWSACRRYLEDRRSDPVSLIENPLRDSWGAGTREVSWRLHLKLGRA